MAQYTELCTDGWNKPWEASGADAGTLAGFSRQCRYPAPLADDQEV